MYTPENYFWGMVVYYVAAFLLLLSCWHLTKFITWRHFRNLLLLFIATLLLVPATVAPDVAYLAPAWFVSLFDGVSGETYGFARAGRPLLFIYLIAVVCYSLAALYCRKRCRKKYADDKDTA